MNQWQETEVLGSICKATEEQRERISGVLAKLTEEDLCDELNVMLCKSGVMERKARKRLGENGIKKLRYVSDSLDEADILQENFQQSKSERDLETYAVQSSEQAYDGKTADIPFWENGTEGAETENPEQCFLRMELHCQKQMAEQMKYMLHEKRNAGIFASEMAKEWIDLREDSLRKLQQYLEEPEGILEK